MGTGQHEPVSGLEVLRQAERLGILGARRAVDGTGHGPAAPVGHSYMRVEDDRTPPEWFVGFVDRTHLGVREFWSWLGGTRHVVTVA